MALVTTLSGASGSATNVGNGGTFTNGSAFTPAANSLLLAWVATQGGPGVASNGIASLSGHGTWTRLDAGGAAGNDQLLELWGLITSGSPSSSAVTATNTTQTKIRRVLTVTQTTGIDHTAALSAIVRQVVERHQGTAGLSGDVTLASFSDATLNGVMIGVYGARYQESISWDSALNNLADTATGTEASRLAVAEDIGQDLTPGFSWGANNRTWRAIAVEIVDPSAGGTDYEDDVTVTVASTVSSTDQLGLTEAGSVTAASTVTTSDRADFNDATNVSVAATVSSTDSLGASEPVSVDLSASIAVSDQLAMTEASNVSVAATVAVSDRGDFTSPTSVDIASTVASTDQLSMVENTSVTITSTVSSTDSHSAGTAYEDDVEVSVAATVTSTDLLSTAESVTVTAAATVSSTDQADFNEAGEVTAAASVSSTDVLALVETGLVTVTSTIVTTDRADFVDDVTVEIVSTIESTDEGASIGYEDNVTVNIVATVVSTDRYLPRGLVKQFTPLAQRTQKRLGLHGRRRR